jgi:hypothetical protein
VDTAKTFAFAPDWLLARCTLRVNGSGKPKAIPASEWRALSESVVVEGTRDSTLTKFAGHLLRRRIDPFVVLTLLQSWNSTHCTPPLPPDDIVRIVDSIAGKEIRRQGL